MVQPIKFSIDATEICLRKKYKAEMKQKTTYILIILILTLSGCVAKRAGWPSEAPQETVVLLHGLGRSGVSMWLLEERLETAGFDVEVIDYKSMGTTPDEVIHSVSTQINEKCKDKSTIHFVGHSLGGLMIRSYFSKPENQYMLEKLGRVVMIGTPNSGTELVDTFKDSWWMALMGETALALGTGPEDLPAKLPVPPFKAGIIAGANGSWISDAIFEEANDGLVPVSSTQIVNMEDFIEIDVNHTMMRYDADVANQTIIFLKTGKFDRSENRTED